MNLVCRQVLASVRWPVVKVHGPPLVRPHCVARRTWRHGEGGQLFRIALEHDGVWAPGVPQDRNPDKISFSDLGHTALCTVTVLVEQSDNGAWL